MQIYIKIGLRLTIKNLSISNITNLDSYKIKSEKNLVL